MKRHAYRVVVESDYHTGSEVGLRTDPQNETQRQLLARHNETIERIGRGPDLLILNGDANDGQDRKGLSVQKQDVPWQIEEAEKLVKAWRPKRVEIVEGTAYHTGDTTALERFLSGYLKRDGIPCEFHTKLRCRINSWFKVQSRHKINRSMMPYGQFTGPARSQAWQVINAALEALAKRQPVNWPHLSIFSHVHYWTFSETAMGSVVTTPCWQALGTRFGDKECDGHVDVGTFAFIVGATEAEGWTWQRYLYPARMESRTVELS